MCEAPKRQARAENKEIEVTPEMIEAGAEDFALVLRLRGYFACDRASARC